MRYEIETNSTEETLSFAKGLAQCAQPGDIFCLTGDLGTGKTVIAKGLGQGLGVEANISSPTFTIVNEYDEPGQKMPFYHFDVYRIFHMEEMDDTGYEEYFYSCGVCLIEWAEIIMEIVPQGAVWITIQKDLGISEEYRKITVCRTGA
ncbi:MAG: tRNA (adenosine(37)-N6)-threonylcarbamoyltransferase complex ATPase subunit type 1 TsaE [Clostridiales bacterium]|jgi:tRNA threonylcarbamoyladenosine biosynthesis protein TsaE|nr:tRNA (adenosine(37)-N6)-threonylcarbamoyltransferase complex ATPase subunit type 1 TsaE [Clostridiales bacterium]